MKELQFTQSVRKLAAERDLPDEELKILLEGGSAISGDGDLKDAVLAGPAESDETAGFTDCDRQLFAEADRVRREWYGDQVYLRGLIELTNYCANDCYYCGIRRSNGNLTRYRLPKETILQCCREGYRLGYRTFVLQGGEDPFYTDAVLEDIVSAIHLEFPDCAITLSVGERSRQSYERLFQAGARRYLLRHEAAAEDLYRKLHPEEMSLANRIRCLYDLKEIGYQVGAGLMVGAPGQNTEHLIKDIRFLQKLQPDMIGIGPYLRHADTPFRDCGNGSLVLSLRLLAILRLMFPYVLLPSTTALATIDSKGREMGLRAGANVVMPNLSPAEVRENYSLYDKKACTGEESAQGRTALERQIISAGYRIVTDVGDVKRAKRPPDTRRTEHKRTRKQHGPE